MPSSLQHLNTFEFWPLLFSLCLFHRIGISCCIFWMRSWKWWKLQSYCGDIASQRHRLVSSKKTENFLMLKKSIFLNKILFGLIWGTIMLQEEPPWAILLLKKYHYFITDPNSGSMDPNKVESIYCLLAWIYFWQGTA